MTTCNRVMTWTGGLLALASALTLGPVACLGVVIGLYERNAGFYALLGTAGLFSLTALLLFVLGIRRTWVGVGVGLGVVGAIAGFGVVTFERPDLFGAVSPLLVPVVAVLLTWKAPRKPPALPAHRVRHLSFASGAGP